MLAFICDDLAEDREVLEQYCIRYQKEKEIEIQTMQFEDAGTLLQNEEIQNVDLLFLDIYMEGTSGIDAARILRGKGYSGTLIFTTTSREHYAEGFDLAAAHYLVKPISWEAFCTAVERCNKIGELHKQTIRVNIGRSELNVDIAGIRYIEVYGHKTIINTLRGEINVNQSLAALEQILQGKPFLKCYRCFLINMDYVQRIEGNIFLMKDNREIPISRDNRIQIKNRYLDYIFSKMEEETCSNTTYHHF